jgi:hypothetical protein
MPILIVILLLVIIAILAPGLVMGLLAIVVKIIADLWSSLPWIIGLAVLFFLVSATTGLGQPKPRQRRCRADHPSGKASKRGTVNPQYAGPGLYRIRGVDRETRMDTVWYCTAETRDNAKAKADLEGIQVTEVQPVEATDEVHAADRGSGEKS